MSDTQRPSDQRPSDDTQVVLLALVAEALDALEDGGPAALEELLARHPAEAATVRRRLEILRESGLDVPLHDRAGLPDVLGDFRLESPIGQGGMGVVWRARQLSLGRDVALKFVRPDQLLFPGARQRFSREVETVARLEHPGIVPVYAVGEERGLPYFAMELVRGASLAQCLRALVERGVERPTGADLAATLPADDSSDDRAAVFFRGAWAEVVARIGREVAEALEHAARRGVVHRDVKPSNVMLTRGGRVLLLDFGLSSAEDALRVTQTGLAVGSLSYMAPEILRREAGATTDADPRFDVYSLGVTLHELLNLAPAFDALGDASLIEAVKLGRARPLDARVPKDLAAIVRVAMDPDPARRYASPGDLARDLDNFLARRPIEARPPSAPLRLARWTQRHPALALAVVAAVLVPSLLLAQELRNSSRLDARQAEVRAANVALASTNDELVEKRLELETSLEDRRASLQRAEHLLDLSMEAVDAMLARVGDETLASVPGMETVRRELLEAAIGFHEEFLAVVADEPRLERRALMVAFKTVNIQTLLGDDRAAALTRARAESLARDIAERTGESDDYRQLITVIVGRGRTQLTENRFDDARASMDEADGYLRFVDERDRALQLGDLAFLRGVANFRLARFDLAEQDFETAGHAIEENLARFDPEDETYRNITLSLSELFSHRGMLFSHRSRLPNSDAEYERQRSSAAYAKAAELIGQLVELGHSTPEMRQRLAHGYSRSAQSRAEEDAAGRLNDLRAASEAGAALMRDFPAVPVFAADAGQYFAELAFAEHTTGSEGAVLELSEASLEAFDEYRRLAQDVETYRRANHAIALIQHGVYLFDLEQDLAGGQTAIDEGFGELDRALHELPSDPWLENVREVRVPMLVAFLIFRGRDEPARRLCRGIVGLAPTRAERLAALVPYERWHASYPESSDRVMTAVLRELFDTGQLERADISNEPRLDGLRALPAVRQLLAAR